MAINEYRKFEGRVLVTGGAGHLGSNLVRRLLEDGRQIRVLLRAGDNNQGVDGLDVERVYGDLRDPGSLDRALEGCETVFHVAAKISTLHAGPKEERDIFECNVLGTRNLMAAAKRAEVSRVVATGSFSAVGYDLDDPSKASNEELPVFPFDNALPYARTKVLSEHECLKAHADGLDVVMVTSCALIGPHDYLPSRMGRTILDHAHGKLRAYVPGGFDWVRAADVIEGHVLAMHRGRPGQKYICSTEYKHLDEIMAILHEVTGRPPTKMRIPAEVMEKVGEVSSFVLTHFFPKVNQRLTPGAIRILKMKRRADTTKAQRELGYRPTNVREAFYEAYEDFARRGLVPPRVGVRPKSRSNGAAAPSPHPAV